MTNIESPRHVLSSSDKPRMEMPRLDMLNLNAQRSSMDRSPKMNTNIDELDSDFQTRRIRSIFTPYFTSFKISKGTIFYSTLLIKGILQLRLLFNVKHSFMPVLGKSGLEPPKLWTK